MMAYVSKPRSIRFRAYHLYIATYLMGNRARGRAMPGRDGRLGPGRTKRRQRRYFAVAS